MNGKTTDVFFHMKDEKRYYDLNGVEWERIWSDLGDVPDETGSDLINLGGTNLQNNMPEVQTVVEVKKLKLPVFKPVNFMQTTNYSANLKAAYCNAFIRFVGNKFHYDSFHDWFFQHTRRMWTLNFFGSNRLEFYNFFFSTTKGKYLFVKDVINSKVIGLPEFTMSDAEKAIQKWLKDNRIDDALLAMMDKELEADGTKQEASKQEAVEEKRGLVRIILPQTPDPRNHGTNCCPVHVGPAPINSQEHINQQVIGGS